MTCNIVGVFAYLIEFYEPNISRLNNISSLLDIY